MKRTIKKLLIKLTKPFASKLGYVMPNSKKLKKLSSNSKNGLLNNFYALLKVMDFKPGHIVDIGANRGTWTREALQHFPDAQFSLFEPQYWLRESIRDITDTNSNVQFNPFGVGKEKGSFKFTIVDRDDSCSFKYSEEEAKNRGFKQIDLPVVTLNDFINEKNLPCPDIIKIDAEGLDLEVLEGANNFFGKTEIYLIEAAVVNPNVPNTVMRVINYMDNVGYKLFDITDLNRPFRTKVLWLVELVFIKNDGFVDNYKIVK
ncbi:MAG: FkbM family methyltransferase [Flavobacteriaceae bacterium]|nr:FkbM family methyltransferase [Flavobacteriaceae bacterium]